MNRRNFILSLLALSVRPPDVEGMDLGEAALEEVLLRYPRNITVNFDGPPRQWKWVTSVSSHRPTS